MKPKAPPILGPVSDKGKRYTTALYNRWSFSLASAPTWTQHGVRGRRRLDLPHAEKKLSPPPPPPPHLGSPLALLSTHLIRSYLQQWRWFLSHLIVQKPPRTAQQAQQGPAQPSAAYLAVLRMKYVNNKTKRCAAAGGGGEMEKTKYDRGW